MATGAKVLSLGSIRAAWLRFTIVALGIGLVVLVLVVTTWPWVFDATVERFVLPEYEAALGFRGGQVNVAVGNDTAAVYALVEVAPDGPMGLAGARSGDIPIARHGGTVAFYHAVQLAKGGERAEFSVLSKQDWPDWTKRRRIVLAPTPKPAEP